MKKKTKKTHNKTIKNTLTKEKATQTPGMKKEAKMATSQTCQNKIVIPPKSPMRKKITMTQQVTTHLIIVPQTLLMMCQ